MNEPDKNNIYLLDFFKNIYKYIKGSNTSLILSFIGFLLFALSQPAFAMLMEAFVRALDGEFVDNLYVIPVACISIALMRGMGSYLGNYYMSKTSASVIHLLRCDLFSNIIQLPIKFFDNNKSGRLVSLFTYNINLMVTATTHSLTITIREGLTVIALLFYLLFISFKLTLIFILLGPPIAFAVIWIGKKIKRYGYNIQSSVAELNHIASEAFIGIRQLKSSVNENIVEKKFQRISLISKKSLLKLEKVSAIYTPFMQVMVIVVMAIVMYIVLLSRGSLDSAQLIAYITAAGLLPKPIRSLSGVHPQLLQAAVAADEVFNHISFSKEIDNGYIENIPLKGNVIFDMVSFSYENNNLVLNDIDFNLSAGDSLAIVGSSGGGKSTLANLIPRFYLPNKGEIKIDGININEFKLNFLRNNIAIVSQNIMLFNDSIKNNISYGFSGSSDKDILSAAKLACLEDFVESLPNGFETIIGENGVTLSGGQRQRIAIARAILSNAKILILDEATSALDNKSEAKIQSALNFIMRDRTTIIIAHRLTTIENANQIIVIEDGEIIEQGTHDNLIDKNGSYSKMIRRDFKN